MKNKKINNLEAVTILILCLGIFIYEFCFCNLNAIKEGTYNFSLYRIVMYIIFILLYKKFSYKFIAEAEKTIKSKKKIIIIYSILILINTIYTFIFQKHNYIRSLIILAELNGLLLILYITKDYIKNIIVTTLTMGFISTLALDAYHLIDEKKHFLSALNLSVCNFNYIENPLTNDKFNEIEFDYPMVNLAMKYFNQKSNFEMHPIKDDEATFSTPADYSFITYIPSSIGINIARFLGGSIADIFIAGRMFNMIAFSIMLIIIFKLLPFKKNLFYALYTIPLAFALAGSYSADGITIGLVGIFIAYTLKIYNEKYDNIKLKHVLVLLLLFLLVLTCKNGSYMGICILVCILPIIKIIKENKVFLGVMSIIFIIAFIIGINQANKNIKPTGDERVSNTSPISQIQFLMENPTNIVKVYKNYLRTSLFNLSWQKGYNLQVFYGDYYSVIAFLLFIFIVYTSITDNSYNFKFREKFFMCLSFFVTFFMTTFILYLAYTEVGALTINGYQPRYLISILPLVLSCFSSKMVVNIDFDDKPYNRICMVSAYFIIVDTLCIITI